jgi:hypothetical protein
MVKVIELLAFPNTAPRPGTKLRRFKGITIHDTANFSPTADAKAHADLLRGAWKTRDTSWHYAIDQDVAYRCIPEDEVTWHAGDGVNGVGNNETISIESCVNVGNDYVRTMGNMAELCADILFRRGIKYSEAYLFQHNQFSPEKKNCPAYIRNHNLWEPFKAAVQQKLSARWAVEEGEHMLIPNLKFKVTDPEGVAVKPAPDIGVTKALTPGLSYGAEIVGTELRVAYDYLWVKHSRGWSAIGTASLSEVYMQSAGDDTSLREQLNQAQIQITGQAQRLVNAKAKAQETLDALS